MSRLDLLTVNDVPGEYPASLYAAEAEKLPPFPTAKGALHANVCVIGGGFTGLSTALHLAERGYDVILLEAQRVGFGASGRNGGQVNPNWKALPDDLAGHYTSSEKKAVMNMAG